MLIEFVDGRVAQSRARSRYAVRFRTHDSFHCAEYSTQSSKSANAIMLHRPIALIISKKQTKGMSASFEDPVLTPVLTPVPSVITPTALADVVVDLTGPLGLQLFRVATAFAYSRERNVALKRIIDPSLGSTASPMLTWLPTIKAEKIDEKETMVIQREEKSAYIPCSQVEVARHAKILGDFRSWRYFQPYRTELLYNWHVTLLDNHPVVDALRGRRGDSGADVFISVCDVGPEFMARALIQVQKRITENLRFIFCVSDTNRPPTLDGEPLHFANSAEKMIALMSMCDHHIVGGSELGWWGAYLDRKTSSLTVACANGAPHEDYYCRSWLVV